MKATGRCRRRSCPRRRPRASSDSPDANVAG
jgi:hypothetical protein